MCAVAPVYLFFPGVFSFFFFPLFYSLLPCRATLVKVSKRSSAFCVIWDDNETVNPQQLPVKKKTDPPAPLCKSSEWDGYLLIIISRFHPWRTSGKKNEEQGRRWKVLTSEALILVEAGTRHLIFNRAITFNIPLIKIKRLKIWLGTRLCL